MIAPESDRPAVPAGRRPPHPLPRRCAPCRCLSEPRCQRLVMRANRVVHWLRKVVPGQVGAQIENRRNGDEQSTDLLYRSRVDRPPPDGAPHLARFERIVDQDGTRLRDRLPERHLGRGPGGRRNLAIGAGTQSHQRRQLLQCIGNSRPSRAMSSISEAPQAERGRRRHTTRARWCNLRSSAVPSKAWASSLRSAPLSPAQKRDAGSSATRSRASPSSTSGAGPRCAACAFIYRSRLPPWRQSASGRRAARRAGCVPGSGPRSSPS